MINELCAIDYCCEDISLIENYELAVNDDTQVWECHHRLEEDGYNMNELRKMRKYYQVPASELKFLTIAEHRRIHNKLKGAWNKGKMGCYSNKTIEKMSNSHRGNTALRGKTFTKYKWLTLTGEIREMCMHQVKLHHPDWILIE